MTKAGILIGESRNVKPETNLETSKSPKCWFAPGFCGSGMQLRIVSIRGDAEELENPFQVGIAEKRNLQRAFPLGVT